MPCYICTVNYKTHNETDIAHHYLQISFFFNTKACKHNFRLSFILAWCGHTPGLFCLSCDLGCLCWGAEASEGHPGLPRQVLERHSEQRNDEEAGGAATRGGREEASGDQGAERKE